MKRLLTTIGLLAYTAFAIACAGSSPEAGGDKGANSNRVTINGSTTVVPIGQKTVEVFNRKHPEVKISISGTGSGDGIKALLDGTTDIAMSSREMEGSEKQQTTAKGINLKEQVIAWDGIVPIVNPENPVTNLTLAQLKDIYTGKVTDWKDVGGKPGTIVVVSRDSSSGTYKSWGEMVLGKESRVMPAAQLQASSGAVAETVAKTPNAIGYVGIGYTNNPSIKSVSVDTVKASADTVLSKTYKIARPLYMFTNGEPKGMAAEYLKFVLSPEGQQIVKEEGFVPLPK